MNWSGSISHRSFPAVTGVRNAPTSPMSWYSGSHEASESSSDQLSQCRMSEMLPARLPQETRTPLGRPVDPDVNCSRARSPGARRAERSGSGQLSHENRRTGRETRAARPASSASSASA